MLKKMLKWFAVFFVAVAAVFAALLFVPKDNGKAYRIKIAKNQGISSVSRNLARDGIVYNRHVLVAAAYITGAHNKTQSRLVPTPFQYFRLGHFAENPQRQTRCRYRSNRRRFAFCHHA